MTPLLLDTCAVIWTGLGTEMSTESITAIDNAAENGSSIFVSAISALEIGLLASRGRQKFPIEPKSWFNAFIKRSGVEIAALEPGMMIDSCYLPGSPPRDPFDRIVLATARTQGMRIVTRDRAILHYAEQGHVLAMEC